MLTVLLQECIHNAFICLGSQQLEAQDKVKSTFRSASFQHYGVININFRN